MPIVTTVFQPDTPRDVGEAEAAELRRQGLLIEDKPTSAAPAPAADAPAASTSTAASAAKGGTGDGGK